MDKVIIYGLGSFYEKYKEDILSIYEVSGYVDRNVPINRDTEVCQDFDDIKVPYDKVLIMVSKVKICFEIIDILLTKGVKSEDIVLGISKWGEYSGLSNIYVDSSGKINIEKGELTVTVGSEDEFINTIDTIMYECYKYHLCSGKRQVVFDVGMNIGDAALYFAIKPEVEAVYGFEPFKKTFDNALININRLQTAKTIKAFNIGLSNRDYVGKIAYSSDMSCGQSTIPNINDKAIAVYQEWRLLHNENLQYEEIEVKKSSDVIKNVMDSYRDVDYILKLDCEGEEYHIFENLSESGLIQEFSLIMLEWHYKSDKKLTEILKENNFSYISTQKSINPDLGLIYAWK